MQFINELIIERFGQQLQQLNLCSFINNKGRKKDIW
jgi:hypothetical protein